MTRVEATDLVFYLIDAVREYERAQDGYRNRAMRDYEELRDKIIELLIRDEK